MNRLHRFNMVLAVTMAMFYVTWWWRLGASWQPLVLVVVLLAIVPLLALAPALWSGNRFGTSLAGFIVPFHFAYAIMEFVANPAVRGWVAVQTFLSLLLLIGVMTSLRQIREPTTVN